MVRHSLFPVLVLVCYIVFACLCALNLSFFEVYGVPLGMSDIDRYASWLGQDISYRTEFTPFKSLQDVLVHGFFISTVKVLGGVYALNWFIPLLIVGCVYASYYLYREWGFSEDSSLLGALLFLFASCLILMFYIVAFYAQLFSLFFFIIALTMYHRRDRPLFIIFMFLSILAHPMITFIWFFYLMSEAWHRGWYYFCVLVGVVAGSGLFVFRAYEFLIFYSKYIPEPSTYLNIGVFCYPFLFPMLFFSPLKVFRYRYFLAILLVTAPFLHLGRGMIYLCLVLCPLAACGFRYLQKNTDYPRLFIIFLLVYWVFWFVYSMDFILYEMAKQMVLRGMGEYTSFINL
jgi:hypothetical protein